MSAHILVVDDERNYLLLLETLLYQEGYTATVLQDPELAVDYLQETEVDILIADMKMPGLSGQGLLEHVKSHYPYIPVIIMTAYGSIDGAVEAMKCGAFDYINKPFSNEELLFSVAKAARMSQAEQQKRVLQQSLEEKRGLDRIMGHSQSMQQVLDLVGRAAPSDSNVLITGEPGTGKELVARTLHFSSKRQQGPFVLLSCSSLQAGLLEEELFGHRKGEDREEAAKRGRFQAAHKGSLFLDEVSELPLEIQALLLYALQDNTVQDESGSRRLDADVRIIASSDRDLEQAVREGRFREDLYYRLNVVNIQLPPLRERSEDTPVLAAHFLKEFSEKNNKEVTGFTPEAMQALTAYHWPGNVRQLENIMERCVALARGGEITYQELPAELKEESSQFKSAADMLPTRINLGEALEKIEAALIRRALVKSDFVQVKAAEMLGISKSLLQYKLKKYNISGKTQ